MRQIFRLETERVLSNDWVVRHENRFYQVEAQSQRYASAKSKVTVCTWEDGTTEIHYRGQKLKGKEIEERLVSERRAQEASPREARRTATGRQWRPAPDHPWRRVSGERNSGRRSVLPSAGALPSLASTFASP